MSDVAVAVVDADTPGNVGTIARAMKNFGFDDLYLVDPPELDRDGEAYGYAGQAREDVLPGAEVVDLDYLVEGFHTVGFTAITNEDARKHTRFPFRTPRELAESLRDVEAETCLVFGRERVGLHNEELARLDEVAAIPASADYPVMNLGQAATVALYELQDLVREDTQLPAVETERAPESEIEAFYDHFGEFLDDLDYPAEKKPKTLRMVRRILGRAHPTGREVNTLRGILRRAQHRTGNDGGDDRPDDVDGERGDQSNDAGGERGTHPDGADGERGDSEGEGPQRFDR